MKKCVLMLLVAVVMMLGMSFTSMADEIRRYEGSGEARIEGQAEWTGWQEVVNAVMEISGDQYRLTYVGGQDGVNYDIVFRQHDVDWETQPSDVYLELISYNGIDAVPGYINWHITVTEEQIILGGKISWSLSDGTSVYNDMGIYLNRVWSLVDEVYEIATPFVGIADSDTGSYSLTIAGQFVAGLTNGTHELLSSEIANQIIAIVAYNNANGVKRVMRETTIEQMTVTVSGGQVTQYVIRGRVQTDGDTLDRYTATINP